nr:variable surface lipoprotein [Mycoplasmopsis bovis]
MKKINKIIISLSSIISISSMPLIAASCENKNPTDESIINNIAPHNSILLSKSKDQIIVKKKNKRRWPKWFWLGSSSNTKPPHTENQE